MKVAYFDCFAGISGDMALGALVDAGLSLDLLKAELDKLKVREFTISQRRVEKHGIAATKVDVDAQEGHVHRHLIDVLYIINSSSISDTAKESARKVFRKLAEAEAKVQLRNSGIGHDRLRSASGLLPTRTQSTLLALNISKYF